MKKQQEKQTPSSCIEHAMSRMPEGMHGMAIHDQRQFDDLARMRIERDRATRHARCVSLQRFCDANGIA